MGSTAKGVISGFICRLCSKMNRNVILIYSKEGEKISLADKINLYLPITVTKNDPLPKTVCPQCVDRLERHSHMIQMIAAAEVKFDQNKEGLLTDDKKDHAFCNNKLFGHCDNDDDDDDDDEDDDDNNDDDNNDENSDENANVNDDCGDSNQDNQESNS